MANEPEGHIAPSKLEGLAPGKLSAVFAGFLLLVAGILAASGIMEAFNYSEADKIVGGDAFNLQILASRGVVLIGAGIVLAVAAIAHLLFSIRALLLNRK